MIHGRYSTYINRHCKCTACREAYREYRQSKRISHSESYGNIGHYDTYQRLKAVFEYLGYDALTTPEERELYG